MLIYSRIGADFPRKLKNNKISVNKYRYEALNKIRFIIMLRY